MADIDSVTLAEALGAGIAAFAGKAGRFGLRLEESDDEHAVTAEERLEVLTAQAEENRNRVSRELASEDGSDAMIHVTLEAESVAVEAAVWDQAYIDNLPDQAFAALEPGKKMHGKTVPLSKRHLPHHTASVKDGSAWDHVDLPHLKNAISRLPQTQISSPLKAQAAAHLKHHVAQAVAKGLMKGTQAEAEAAEWDAFLEALAAGGTADYPKEDAYWASARKRMGLQEAHKNALYLTATLLHVDKPNSNGDILPRAEAELALPSLVGQPIDIAPGMDAHERERLYGMNGIRGFVYAARLVADAIQIGCVLWAFDFPDIAEGVVDFRDSLGASFDLVARSADYTNVGDPDAQTERNLRGVTFLGGAILAKNRAADSTTQIGDVRYGGKTIEQIEEEQRMADTAKEAGAQAATTVVTPTTEIKNAVETALAQAQAEVTSLTAKLETAGAAQAVADEKLAQVQAERDALQVRADEAQAKLDERAETEARAERVKTRVAALEAMASENKRVLAEKDEEKAALAASVADLTDEQFETFKLKKELELLKTGAKAGDTSADVQATAGAGAQGGVFGVLNAGGAGLAGEKPAELGRRFVEASRRKAE